MSYTPTNGAIDIVKEIATKRNDAAPPANNPFMLALINSSPTPPVVVPPIPQEVWDQMLADFSLANLTLGWDALLEKLLPKTVNFELGNGTIVGNDTWKDVPGSSWPVLASSPRPQKLTASFAIGLLFPATNIAYRLLYDGNSVANGIFRTQNYSSGMFFTLPTLHAVVEPAYPLVSKIVKVQVFPITGVTLSVSDDCIVSYALG